MISLLRLLLLLRPLPHRRLFKNLFTPHNSSTVWHAIFAFQIAATGTIIQMHFPNSSPLDEYSASIWIFVICSLFYCFAFGFHIKCQIHTPADATTLNRCVKVAFTSGSLAYTALISMLLHHSLIPLVFIVSLMLLFVYFFRKKIAEMGGNMASYMYDLWRRTKSRASNLYDQWRRTESSDVPTINRPPV